MTELMTIKGHQAVISYDPGIWMFYGTFPGLSADAVFYAKDINDLQREGERCLEEYLVG